MTGRFGDDLFGDGTFGGITVPATSGAGYTIEVAFTVPLLGLPSGADWTDVTEYVRSFSTRRGRNHELGKMQAGEASLTLDNRDRRFDPTNTAGPYYPNVVPMRHVRIRVTTSVGTYDLFRGYVEDWGQQWSGPAASGMGDARCEVHLVDGFAVLNRIDLTAYESEVLNDAPVIYWPLGGLVGASVGNLGSVSLLMRSVAGGTFAALDGPLDGGATGMRGDVAWSDETTNPDELRDLKNDVSVEFWLYRQAGNYSEIVTILSTTGSSDLVRAGVTTGGSLYFGHSAGLSGSAVSSTVVGAAAWHHCVITKTGGGTVSFYVDGVLTDTKIYSDEPGKGTISGVYLNIVNYLGTPDMRLAHVAVYGSVLSPERVAAHYGATMGAIAAQTVDQAITEVLSAIGWPGASITASGHTVQAHIPNANVLTELLMLAEDTDGGLLFLTADGTLRFLSSEALRHDVTAAASWGDSSAELKYSDLVLRYDDEDLWTEVRATAEGLVDALASDSAASITYGPRTLETSGGVLADQHQLEDRATGYLTRYKAPAVRPESLTAVDSTSQPSRMAEMFSSEIGRRVTVTRRPPGGGSAITLQAITEGVSHSPVAQMTQMRTTLNLVPVLDPTPWLLEDATNGVLGTTTDLGW